jgi:outer membrane protein
MLTFFFSFLRSLYLIVLFLFFFIFIFIIQPLPLLASSRPDPLFIVAGNDAHETQSDNKNDLKSDLGIEKGSFSKGSKDKDDKDDKDGKDGDKEGNIDPDLLIQKPPVADEKNDVLYLSAQDHKKKGRVFKVPQLEIGFGVNVMNINNYRGSDQTTRYIWPIPFFIFRTKTFEAQNTFMSGTLYTSGKLSVALSLMATLRVNSHETIARNGMPNLDPTIEIGPIANYELWRSDNAFITLSIPLRTVTAAHFFAAKHVGFFSVPFLGLAFNPQPATLGTFQSFSIATMFGSKKYHEYFYSVAPEYATPNRPAYEPSAGYSGAHVTWFGSKKWREIYFYGFYRYDRLEGAVFEDSPLVRTKGYTIAGGGIIWYFHKSDDTVHRKMVN